MPLVPVSHCLACGRLCNEAAGVVNAEDTPSPGDFSLCLYCGNLMAFNDGLKLRKPTSEEARDAADNPDIQRAYRAISRSTEDATLMSDDPDLFSYIPHARPSDPATSHAAIPRKLKKQAMQVLKAYADGSALMDRDAYRRAGLGEGWQRCSDLREAGYIICTGDTGTTPKGKAANICRITLAGLERLKVVSDER